MICVTSADTIRTPVVDVIGQLISDVIGRLSVEPRCDWLRRLNSGAFRSVYRSKVCACVVKYVGRTVKVDQCAVCLLMSSMSRL